MGELIRNTRELGEACEKAAATGVLALDTEFIWRRTYRPHLCVLQFAGADGESFAIDCLAGLDTSPLARIVEDPAVVKVLHAAQQDLEHIRHFTGALPKNVFDTQVAAAFAGFRANAGLQKLLFDAINVGLPKTETLTDWMQRPLTSEQVEYALDDVRFLGRLRADLLRRADELGTRAWLDEEMSGLDDPSRYDDPDPRDAWLRVKTGHVSLDRRGFAALRELAAVRERKALEWNLPRTWLSEDLSLANLANFNGPVGRVRFRHRLPNNWMRDALALEYASAIEKAAALDESEYPLNPHPHYISEVKEAADKALEWMKGKAEEIRVDAPAIANRATVIAFVDNVDDDSNPLATGWRFEAVGREMAERFGVD